MVQRGHNRQVAIVGDGGYTYYRDNLVFFKQEFGCKICAYCPMTNHVHHAVDPGANPVSLSKLLKRVGGRQTRYVNKLEKHSGSIWEGRFKSSIMSTDEYLPVCCSYIEFNLLRAGTVRDPVAYRWSSYRCKVEEAYDPVVDLPPYYLALGDNKEARRQAYVDYVLGTVSDYEIILTRDALQRGQVTGSERFRKELVAKLSVRLSNRGKAGQEKSENESFPFFL